MLHTVDTMFNTLCVSVCADSVSLFTTSASNDCRRVTLMCAFGGCFTAFRAPPDMSWADIQQNTFTRWVNDYLRGM